MAGMETLRRTCRFITLSFLLITACSSSSTPWWITKPGPGSNGTTSSCAVAGEFRVLGRVRNLGDCQGELVDPAPVLTLHVGDKIDLHMQAAYWPVHSSKVAVVREVSATNSDRVVTFEAIARGSVVLLATGNCRRVDQPQATANVPCPVRSITVIAK